MLGVALAGFAVVPFVELLAHSARDAVPLDVYRRAATPVVALAQALLPDVFGHPVDGTYWFGERATLLDGVPAHARYWGFNAIGQNLFTGVAPLALALLAARRVRSRPDVALFGAVRAGQPGRVPARRRCSTWPGRSCRGFRYSRPDRVIFIYMAAVAVLAAHGADALRAERNGAPPGPARPPAAGGDRRRCLPGPLAVPLARPDGVRLARAVVRAGGRVLARATGRTCGCRRRPRSR